MARARPEFTGSERSRAIPAAMKPVARKHLVGLHLAGYAVLAFQALLVAFFGTTAFFVAGLASGILVPAGPVLSHLFLSFLFLALFPGQRIWTFRLTDCHGQPRTIVGCPSEFELYHGAPGLDI